MSATWTVEKLSDSDIPPQCIVTYYYPRALCLLRRALLVVASRMLGTQYPSANQNRSVLGRT